MSNPSQYIELSLFADAEGKDNETQQYIVAVLMTWIERQL